MLRTTQYALAETIVALALSACGSGGGGSGGDDPVPAPTVSLSASSTNVAAGATVQLTWSSTNASSCAASGGWTGAQATSGSAQVGPVMQTSTFGLSCTGSGGNGERSVTVNVQTSVPQTDIDRKSGGSPLRGNIDPNLVVPECHVVHGVRGLGGRKDDLWQRSDYRVFNDVVHADVQQSSGRRPTRGLSSR